METDQRKGLAAALELVERAAAMLHADGDAFNAMRLRDTAALVRGDRPAVDPQATGAAVLLIMRAALVLLEQSGDGFSGTACHLQAAIDHLRGLVPSDALIPDETSGDDGIASLIAPYEEPSAPLA